MWTCTLVCFASWGEPMCKESQEDLHKVRGCFYTHCSLFRATLDTRDWEPVSSTLQALSLVEKAEPVQVRYFTLCLRDQWSKWMQDGCKVYMNFYRGIKWIMFHGHLDYFRKSLLGGRSNTKLGDHDIPNAHNYWYILFYHAWGPTWIEIYWNNIWLRARSHMTSHYTWESVTTLHDFGGVLGRPMDIFFWALTISWSRILVRVWSGP